MGEGGVGSNQRVDQWLWFARITKSRTLAQDLIARGKVRVNRIKIDKPSILVKPGDVLTLVVGPAVRSLEVLAIGARRGPAAEARLLFNDLTSAAPRSGAAAMSPEPAKSAARPDGAGRPTKRDRRQIDKLKGRS
ncbi:RNA-binding S4 domain-containing protein [Hyphomicrobium denitrificans 1NES1]|uniref:RNA-binding S4 domain-containing protein n=1 Tax=Hyphomicrobium denitrificans 1NES1 TaxID=670307 RepID=N0BH59_9HYPH|nr:RNA-binding S4 domain-containing protein [Hyphomicrobium denitrificans]AGK59465.1 RNA-binding S4 domain-containing protein [Hyphomicrobium denitrificans 1NES1]